MKTFKKLLEGVIQPNGTDKIKIEALKDTCWKGYQAIGTKKKNGREVPNCVPVKEEALDEGKMAQLHADIEDHLGKHVANYKKMGGAEHLGNKTVEVAKKIAKLHNISHQAAQKHVNDYVDNNLKESDASWAASQEKKKEDRMTDKDKGTLGKIRDLMAKEKAKREFDLKMKKAQNSQRVAKALGEEKKEDLPFTPDAPKKNPVAKAGKFGLGYSIAKHLAKQGMKKMTKEDVNLTEEHVVHVSDGSKYDEEPHKDDVKHVNDGVKKHGGKFDGHSDKGAFFKFGSHADAENFRRHVNACPKRSCSANHLDESVNEAVDKEHPIYKEYQALRKMPIKDLRNHIKQQHRIIDTSEFRTKEHAASHIINTKHGNKRVKAVFGEETELDEKYDHGPIDREAKVKVGHHAAVVAGSGVDSGKHGKVIGQSKTHIGDQWHIKTSDGEVVKMYKNRVAKLKEESELNEAYRLPSDSEIDKVKAHVKANHPNKSLAQVAVHKASKKIEYVVKDKDGKMTGHTLGEEVEQIDEISKQTLGNYIKRSSHDAALSARHGGSDPKELKNAIKRLKGIAKATNKLTKEESEHIEEDKNGSWVVHKDGEFKGRFATHKGAKAHAEKHGAKVASSEYYNDHIAPKKNVKEDVEQIDEISKDTLHSYIHKAFAQGNDLHYDLAHSRGDKATDAERKALQAKLSKRNTGIIKAGKKLREDVSMLSFEDYLKEQKACKKEELHPNQKKLDVNKNGKLDSDDFVKLRAGKKKDDDDMEEGFVSHAQRKAVWASRNEKGVKEEANKVYDPITKKMVDRKPIKTKMGGGATRNGVPVAGSASPVKEETEYTIEDFSIEEIEDFMMSEDFEQLDEISKQVLGSYVKKASADIAKREVRIDRAMDASGSNYNEPSMQKALNKNVKRVAGLNKAADKLAKEEVELDEAMTPMQKLKDALDRHSEKAVAANKAGDHEAVKVHQGYMNKIKTKMAKLAKNEEIDLNEMENLCEISKKTLGSYVKKASQNAKAHRADAEYTRDWDKEQSTASVKKAQSREAGVKKAINKLNKEEVEQIDEISAKTKLSYIDKASRHAASHVYAGKDKANWAGHYTQAGDWESSKKAHDQSAKEFNKANKRLAGVKAAVKSLAKNVKEEASLQEGDYYHEKVAKALPKGLKSDHEILNHAHDHMQKDLKGKYSKNAIHRMVHFHHDNDFPSDLVTAYHHVNKTNEEVEQIDELSKKTLASYIPKAAQSARFSGMTARDMQNRSDRARNKGMKDSYHRLSMKYKNKAWDREDNIAKAAQKLAKEDVEQIDELSKKTLQSYQSKIGHDLDRAMDAMPHGTGDDKEDRKLNNRMVGDERAQKRLMKMNKEDTVITFKDLMQNISEAAIDDLKDRIAARKATQSAYDKDYKPAAKSNVQKVKGHSYGAGEEEGEDDEDTNTKKVSKPAEPAVKRGRGRPAGSKSGARR